MSTITTEEFIASAIEEGITAAALLRINELNDALTYTKEGKSADLIQNMPEETRRQLAYEANSMLGQAISDLELQIDA